MRLRSTRAGTTAHQRRVSPWAIYNDLTGGVLDSRISFSRAGLATMFNGAGQLVWAPANLVLNSVGISGVGIGTSSATAATTADASPTGGASRVAKLVTNAGTSTTGNNGDGGLTFNAFTVAQGQSFDFSFYARTGDTGFVKVRENVATGARARINLTDGTVASEVGAINSATIGIAVFTQNAGGGWWRVVVRRVASNTTLNFTVKGGLDTGDGVSGDLISCPQVEPTGIDSPKAYNPTTGAAYHGPRFPFDPVTLQPMGLQIEAEARANLAPQSGAFGSLTGLANNAGTNSTGPTYAGNGSVRFTGDGLGGVHSSAAPALVVAASTAHTVSLEVCASSNDLAQIIVGLGLADATVYVNFRFSTGAVVGMGAGVSNPRVTSMRDGTYRVSFTFTTNGAPTPGVAFAVAAITANSDTRLVSNTFAGTIDWRNGQLEVGASASSYIPTTGAAVTRAADAANITGDNFPAPLQSASAYTLYADSRLDRSTTATTYPMPLRISTTANDSRVSLYFTGASTTLVGEVINAVGGFQGSAGAPAVPGLFYRAAFRAQTNDLRAAINGALTGPDTSAAVPAGVMVRSDIGALGFMGHLKAFGIAPIGLPGAELLALTA